MFKFDVARERTARRVVAGRQRQLLRADRARSTQSAARTWRVRDDEIDFVGCRILIVCVSLESVLLVNERGLVDGEVKVRSFC